MNRVCQSARDPVRPWDRRPRRSSRLNAISGADFAVIVVRPIEHVGAVGGDSTKLRPANPPKQLPGVDQCANDACARSGRDARSTLAAIQPDGLANEPVIVIAHQEELVVGDDAAWRRGHRPFFKQQRGRSSSSIERGACKIEIIELPRQSRMARTPPRACASAVELHRREDLRRGRAPSGSTDVRLARSIVQRSPTNSRSGRHGDLAGARR